MLEVTKKPIETKFNENKEYKQLLENTYYSPMYYYNQAVRNLAKSREKASSTFVNGWVDKKVK